MENAVDFDDKATGDFGEKREEKAWWIFVTTFLYSS